MDVALLPRVRAACSTRFAGSFRARACDRSGRAAALALALGLAMGTTTARADADKTAEPKPVVHTSLLAGHDDDALSVVWKEVRDDLGRSAWDDTVGRLPHLITVRRDLGLRNLEPLSAVLLHAADEAAKEGSKDAARGLADAAAQLSPDMLAAGVAQMRYAFEVAPLGLGDQVRAARSTVERLGGDLHGGVAVLGNTLSALVTAWAALALLFAIAMILRYGRFAANDIRRILPRGVTRLQANVLFLALLVAPFVMGLGLLAMVAAWLVVTSLYQSRTERVVAILLLVCLGLLPSVTSRIVRTMAFGALPETTLNRCQSGLCGGADEGRIRAWSNTHVLPYESNFVLGLLESRRLGRGQGNLENAVRHASLANASHETPESQTLLGNLAYFDALSRCVEDGQPDAKTAQYIRTRQEEAVSLWKHAFEMDDSILAPIYNAQAVLRQLGEDRVANPLLEHALRMDTMAVVHWTKEIARENNLLSCRMTDHGNRHVMAPQLPVSRLRAHAMAQLVPNDALIMPFGRLAMGGTGMAALGGFGWIGFIAILALWALSALVRMSRACAQCEEIADPRERLDVSNGSICGHCLLTDIRRALTDAKEQWFREKLRREAASRRERWARLVTWVAPGFGHLLNGKPLRGVALLGSVLVLGAIALGIHEVVMDPRSAGGHGTGRYVLLGTIGAICWLVAIVDSYATGRSS